MALLLRYNFEAEGYAVESATRGDEAEMHLTRNGAPTFSSLTGCCPAYRALRFAGNCGRGRRRAHCQSSW
jgi:hypothetical protein